MKIARVEAVPVRLPFAELGGPPLRAFGRPFTAFELSLVRVETDDGIVGWGEGPWGFWRPIAAMIEEFVAPVAVGYPAGDIARVMGDLQRLMYVFGRHGIAMYALSALDIALWDIAGKAAGQPLHRLLGSRGEVAVPAYVSVWAGKAAVEAYDADRKEFVWDIADQEIVAAQVRGAMAAGFRHVKLHSASERDMRIAREVGGSQLGVMIDASCRWTLDEARAAARRIAPYQPYWLEEPIFPPEDYASLARLRSESGLPIAAGENACTHYEFAAMFDAGAVTFAQPNVTRVGGVSEFRAVLELADARGVEVCPFSSLFGPGFLATMQLMAARPRPGMIEHVSAPLEATLYGGLTAADGHYRPPAGPGLGCDPDPDVLRDYRIRDSR